MKGPGEYVWSFKIEDLPTTAFNSIYVGLVAESKKDDTGNLFNPGSSAYVDLVNSA